MTQVLAKVCAVAASAMAKDMERALRLPTFDEYQGDGASPALRRLPHAHRHGSNHMVRVGNECELRHSLISLLFTNNAQLGAGKGRRPLIRHWSRQSSSLLVTDRRVRGSSPSIRLNFASARRAGCASLFFPGGFSGANPTAVRTLRDQPLVNLAVRVIHHQALSSSVCFAGSKPSEASNGRVPKYSRPFHKKAGELPNVGG